MDWVFDTDMGLDDQIALLYFATLSNNESSNFKLKAVTTQGVGLAHAQSAKENAIRLMRFAGISSADLPSVGIGDQDTLDGYHQYPSAWRYIRDALNGAIIPSYAEDIAKQNNQSTALLKKILTESSEKISILALGAHTTLAKVLIANPELAKKIERVVSMVGAVYVDGNIKAPPSINKKAEFNAWIDPVASKILFDSGVPIKMVPLDVTDKAPLTQDFIDKFRAGTQGPVANVILKWWENTYKTPVGEYYHWDPLATVIALFPDIATRTEEVKVSVQAGLVPQTSVPYGSVDDFSLLNWQGKLRSSLDPEYAGWTKPDNAGKSVDVVLDSNILGFEDKMISAFAPKYRFAFISDTGGPIASSTSFYYNTTNNNFVPTNSLGPGPSAVSSLVQSWKPSEIFAIGDLSYNVGASTTIDAAIGQYYNNFIYPYPSKLYLGKPYDSINGIKVKEGELQWPYNVYNHPVGFPNPIVTNQIGGSPDKLNHFWSALGNHDYGLEIGYAQIGATPYSIEGKDIGSPKGPSSAPTFQSFIDYFLPFLNDPTILGQNKNRLNIGSSDISVNNGAYYSMSFAGTEENPLIEVFLLDTERLNINAGMEDWNPTGKKEYDRETSLYKNEVKKDRKYSLNYNPADPNSEPFLGTTTNPDNGFEQFEWLTKSLSSSKAKWKILTGHHPVYASGRYFDKNPDDHMSNAYLQKLLKALPVGSFDAYYNGHDHFYERVLETNSNGIGLGIPFITNGNNGRNLEAKIQIPYGTSLYNPLPGNSGNLNPNKDATRQLLPSNPTVVGSSGLSWQGTEQEGKHVNGLYGYGFGAVKLDFDQDYLFFNYQEAPLIDPAISNHLAGGINPEQGFNNTTSKDWTPNPNGIYVADKDLATFKLSITNGVVNKVEIINKGQGYMSSKAGNYTVAGFNIYGNNVDMKKPWLGTAQVDLTFIAGKLENINLTDGGIGYDLAVKAAAENNNATTTDGLEPSRDLIVAINYHLDEIQYKVRDDSLYNDWYLITDTIAESSTSLSKYGSLSLSLLPKSADARDFINGTALTTGYNSSEQQQKFDRAQSGALTIKDPVTGLIIGAGTLRNGSAMLSLTGLASSEAVSIGFAGDPSSSFQINFKSSESTISTNFIYRSYDPISGSHFYSSSPLENKLATTQNNYRFEQVEMLNKGSTPIYRFYNPAINNHFYTLSLSEKDSLINAKNGYQFEGIAFMGSEVSYPTSTAVHRLFNPSSGKHFYTSNENEANLAIASSGYRSEGIGWWF